MSKTVVIVGGGLVGLSSALFLTEAGADVTIIDSAALGSLVPIQPNSMRNRERSRRGEVAPWLMQSGRMNDCRSRRTWRNPAPFGAHNHLWQLPV